MGFEYFKRPLRVVGSTSQLSSIALSTGTITADSFKEGAVETRTTVAQLALATEGISYIDASTAGTGPWAFTLGPPPAAGVHKYVILKQNANTTRVISLATTADHYNSTRNSYQTVTGKARNGSQYAWHFVGTTAGTWAVVSQPLLTTALTYT